MRTRVLTPLMTAAMLVLTSAILDYMHALGFYLGPNHQGSITPIDAIVKLFEFTQKYVASYVVPMGTYETPDETPSLHVRTVN